jgi:hypothetical protein
MSSTRTLTFSQAALTTFFAAMPVAGGVIIGNAASATASNGPKIYYACVKAGNISNVGTSSPNSTGSGSKVISWNQVGPAGVPGPAGSGMDYKAGTATTNLAGDAFIFFASPLSDANYSATVTPSAREVFCSISNKTANGFTIHCELASVALQSATYFDGLLQRQTESFESTRLTSWAGSADWIVVPAKGT